MLRVRNWRKRSFGIMGTNHLVLRKLSFTCKWLWGFLGKSIAFCMLSLEASNMMTCWAPWKRFIISHMISTQVAKQYLLESITQILGISCLFRFSSASIVEFLIPMVSFSSRHLTKILLKETLRASLASWNVHICWCLFGILKCSKSLDISASILQLSCWMI